MNGPSRRLLLLAGAVIPLHGAAGESGVATAAVVEQPRSFGHAVGDVLTQRVLLAPDSVPAAAALPGAQRLSTWIERRPTRVERGPDGRRWLVVDYQLVNAPLSPTTVRIPAWSVPGDATRQVAAWPVTVSPVAPRAAPGDAAWQLRPDRPAPAIATGPLRLRLQVAATALAACLAAWAGWLAWRRRRDTLTQPFAAALRTLGRTDPEGAWRALHEAFDRTAGEVLRTSTLPRLFVRAPQFEPLRGRIEAFYDRSAARFFGDAPADPGADAAPLALCRDLRRIERRTG